MQWNVSYIQEKQLFEISYKGNTGVIGLQFLKNDPNEIASYLNGLLNDLENTK